MLKSMMIVETSGVNVADDFGASGVMQIKRAFWDDRARAAGYDLGTDEGQIGMAAAIVGGSVPGVSGTTPTERFLSTYYPIPGGLDVPGESGHTQRMYLEDIAFYSRLIEEAGGSQGDAETAGTAAGTEEIVFGRVPLPPIRDRIIHDKPENVGWDDRGPRKGSIVGTCVHMMEGTLQGTDNFFRLPGVGALTDYGIGNLHEDGPDLDGVIFMWNDPEGGRSPWASGWGDEGPGIEADGQAFIDAYGTPAINKQLVSIELSGFFEKRQTPVSDKQFESLCQLIAYWHDRARVPWHAFPVNPATGVVTQLQHWEFAKKACPGAIVRGMTDAYQRRVKEIMRQHQTAGGPVASTTTTTATVAVTTPEESRLSKMKLPEGVTVDDLRKWFGEHFDPDGEVTLAWAAQGVRTGLFPRLVRLDPPGPIRDFEFENGMKIRAEQGSVRVIGGTG
jgi:hypothetical protein